MTKELKILLASPRGFCAGVDRAIEIVKKTLEKYGPPVYIRHEIVHNKSVVESLKKLGAVFIEVILNQELGEPFRRDAMKKPVRVAGIKKTDMKTQKSLI